MLAYWLWPLAAITFAAALASLGDNLAISLVLWPLAVGVSLLGVFYMDGGSFWIHIGGYFTMFSAFAAFYTGTAMMMAGSVGRVVLPMGKLRQDPNVPGHRPNYPIEFELGEPGVRHGQ